MATKTISGSYPSGYALKSAYQELDITTSATVGGGGVSTVSTHPSTVNNLGSVQGRKNGILLRDGGTLVNGSSSVTNALIEGTAAVVGINAAADITNYGTIRSDQTRSFRAYGGYEVYKSGPSISLGSGGTITNAASGTITNGISVAGASAAITNLGTIHGTSDPIAPIGFAVFNNGYGVFLAKGGTITNGSETNTKASIDGYTYGVLVSGAAATVLNYGSIDATYYNPVGVQLDDGGTIVNGSASDTTAEISGDDGVIISGTGTLKNFGAIYGSTDFGTAVTFKSSSDTLIEEATGTFTGAVLGGGGTLQLDGEAGAGSITGIGDQFLDFAAIAVNAAATWTFTGTNAVSSNTTLTNFGTASNSGTLTNDGTIVVSAGQFTNTSNLNNDKGATLTDAALLTNSGTLTNDGAIVLSGQTVNSGTIANESGATLSFSTDVSITTDPATKTGAITNAGTIRKTGGSGTSILRTGTGTLTDTGTIDVQVGTLELTGATVVVSGAIGGAGTIAFGPGTTTLGAGTSLSSAGLSILGADARVVVAQNLSYAGTFSAGLFTDLSINSGRTLTLTGTSSFLRDTVDGAGTLTTKGAISLNTVTLGGTATWSNAGTITAVGPLTVGDADGNAARFINQAGGTFALTNNAGIAAGKTATTFFNSGTFAKTSGSLSTVAPGFANSGTIKAAAGTLEFLHGVSGTGKATIGNKAVLQFDAAVSAGEAVSFTVGGGTLVLGASQSFAGSIGNLKFSNAIDLKRFAATSETYTANAQGTGGTLRLTAGAATRSLILVGSYTTAGFKLTSDKAGGTLVTYTEPKSMAAAASTTGSQHSAFTAQATDLGHALFAAAYPATPLVETAATSPLALEHHAPLAAAPGLGRTT